MAKELTRKKILKAAELLFSKNGYDGVPTKAIASEAGITEMTLFNHFPSKELLYKTVVRESYLSIEIESIYPSLLFNDIESDLLIISEKLIRNFLNNRKFLLMRLKEKQSFQNDKSFNIETDPLLKQIKPFFESYAQKGLIKNPSDKVALLYMISFKGICHLCLLEDKSEAEIKILIKDFIHIFCYGMIK